MAKTIKQLENEFEQIGRKVQTLKDKENKLTIEHKDVNHGK